MSLRAASLPFLASTAVLVGYAAYRLLEALRRPPQVKPLLPTPLIEDRSCLSSEPASSSRERTEAEGLSDWQWLLADDPNAGLEVLEELPTSLEDEADDEYGSVSPEDLGEQWLTRATDSEPPPHAPRLALDRNAAAEMVGQSSLDAARGLYEPWEPNNGDEDDRAGQQ